MENDMALQKISLRRRECRLAAHASHSAVSVDFPETSPSVILCGRAVLITAGKVLFFSVWYIQYSSLVDKKCPPELKVADGHEKCTLKFQSCVL